MSKEEQNGVWRTIRGRRVFIREGESLGSAMSRSGKFKREDIRASKREESFYARNRKNLLGKSYNERKAEKNINKFHTKYYEKPYNEQRINNNFKDNQAEKNRPNENAPLNEKGKTRVERNYPRYSQEQQREVRHEELQKKLADYKAKKQSNNKVETWEEKVKRLEKENAKNKNYEIPKQSNNKVDTEDYPRASGATKWENLGLKVNDKKAFSDYLRDKYGTDDFRVINYDNKENAKKIYKDFTKNQEKEYYKGTQRWGFGYANDDNIPVYKNKIDYTGDFTHANLSKVSDRELTKILNKQSELYHEASNRQVGDRRTYNGKKDEIFKRTETLRYENGMKVVNDEMQKRNMPRYNIYNEKNNMLLVSSPTKEIASKQLTDMYETDKKLGEHYGWKEYPTYKVKKTTMAKTNKEFESDPKKTIANYRRRKGK